MSAKSELNKDDTGGHDQVDEKKTRRPQPYTK